jgi:thiol-disulfide isomerase/thioredoxin
VGPAVTASQTVAPQAKAATPEAVAESAGASLIGKYAPAITLRTLDGERIDLAKLCGKKPVYLKFWATWSVRCRLQMPRFENVEKTLGEDIQVEAVDCGFETKLAVVSRAMADGASSSTCDRMERFHGIMLGLSLVPTLGAVGRSHGVS